MSPALVAEYRTRLPDKNLLRAKLHEFYEQARQQPAFPAVEDKKPATRQPKNPRKARKR
jgi:hypothetical protein